MADLITPPTTADLADVRNSRRTSSVVCAGCGCLCDDIGLVVEERRLLQIENACPIGERWFRSASVEPPGKSVPDVQSACRRAAELLRGARAPVILGLTETTVETVRVAAAIADRIGAAIDPGMSRHASGPMLAFQRQGKIGATLGELRNRADVVVFWGADPARTHPRHLERYSVDPSGRFRPRGRADRTVIVVDHAETETSKRADSFVEVPADRELEALWRMRAALAGKRAADPSPSSTIAPARDSLAQLVDRLRGAEYGAIFVDTAYGASSRSNAAFEAMALFVRELNAVTRCVVLSLGGPGNRSGAEAVLSWQTGFPQAVDLGSGHPESIPGVTSAVDRLARGEADCALIVADPLPADFPASAIEHLKKIPSIVIAPASASYHFEPTVRIVTGNSLLTTTGTVIRCDGVSLPLRAPLRSDAPSDRDCLREIAAMLDTVEPDAARRI